MTTPTGTTLPPFQVSSAGVQSALSQFQAMTGTSGTVVGSVESLVLDAMSFAGIGSAVGSANNSLYSQLVGGLGKVVNFVETLGGTVGTALQDYQQLDQKTADSFKSLELNGGQGGSAASTPFTMPPGTNGTTGTASAAATAAGQTAAGQTQPVVPDQLVDSLMTSEGAHGNQGGIDEVYGFRQSSHNGYDQVMAARRQYGQGSPQERQVVADLLTKHAEQADAQDFTDPGVRAAIASSAHMRGPAGTKAILNSMITGHIQQGSSSISADNLAQLQQLPPDQFQQQFTDARIAYDKAVYGNTTTHVHGVKMTWWAAYGHGLTERYGREQNLFDSISQQASGQGGGQ